MAWAYVIRAEDRASFKRCRRAWDLGSRSRQNYEPVQPLRAFDFDAAMHDALALYYFPGMWEWDRSIVLPMVLEGFARSMDRQRANCVAARALTAAEEDAWDRHLDLGEAILTNYFGWAPTVDDFEPLKVASDFVANIRDPSNPDRDLALHDHSAVQAVRYQGRSDILAIDPDDAYWIVDHRLSQSWLDVDELVLDEAGIAACWAWQNFNLGMKIAGIIYNELRKVAPTEPLAPTEPIASLRASQDAKKVQPASGRGLYKQAHRAPDYRIKIVGNAYFRRTAIARTQIEIENAGRLVASEAQELINPTLSIYPTPAWENCSQCAFRRPCIAMTEGKDATSILELAYRKRGDDEFAPGRLGGSTWSFDRGGKPPDV